MMRAIAPRLLVAALGLAPVAGAAWADNITVDKFPSPNVEVKGFGNDGTLSVQMGATLEHYPLSKVDHLDLEASPQFSVAEDTAAKANDDADWAKAADRYVDAIKSLPPETRAVGEARAIKSLDHSGRFVDATRYFLDVLKAAPAVSIFDLKPTNLPDTGSKLLADASALVNKALLDKTLQDTDVQKNLKLFLLDIYNKAGDSRAAPLAHDLGETTPGEQVDAAAVNDGSGDTTVVDNLIAGKKFDDALQAIDAQLSHSQGDTAGRLLAAKAQAYEGLRNNDAALLTYLQLGMTLPDNSFAPNALLKAAGMEKSVDPAGANALYALILQKYPDSPAALAAKKNQS
jgi:hypothetical protein